MIYQELNEKNKQTRNIKRKKKQRIITKCKILNLIENPVSRKEWNG